MTSLIFLMPSLPGTRSDPSRLPEHVPDTFRSLRISGTCPRFLRLGRDRRGREACLIPAAIQRGNSRQDLALQELQGGAAARRDVGNLVALPRLMDRQIRIPATDDGQRI